MELAILFKLICRVSHPTETEPSLNHFLDDKSFFLRQDKNSVYFNRL